MTRVSPYRETSAPGEGHHPSLALANSSHNAPDGPVDELDTPASLRAWLRAHGLVARRHCDVADVTAFRELREGVRELLLARIERRVPAYEALSIVNRAAAAAPSAPRLEWAADGPWKMRDSLGGEDAALARALLAMDAIELVVGREHPDLRACAAPGCVRLLVRDHPRRQWCSTRCGDRVRASRYYHRHHRQ